MHDLNIYVADLPAVEDWLAGDDRTLAFRVTDANGDGVDITNATVEWAMYERPYESDPADAVLSGQDSDIEIVTDNRVDTSVGEFEVRVDGEATADLWGEFTHRPSVEQTDGTRASWVGPVILTA
jgi:hypothetical protein